MSTPPAPQEIAAAKKGFPDTITAKEVLVRAVEAAEAELTLHRSEKCAVLDCPNRRREGAFNGPLCWPCSAVPYWSNHFGKRKAVIVDQARLERIAGTLWHQDRRWLLELVEKLKPGALR